MILDNKTIDDLRAMEERALRDYNNAMSEAQFFSSDAYDDDERAMARSARSEVWRKRQLIEEIRNEMASREVAP